MLRRNSNYSGLVTVVVIVGAIMSILSPSLAQEMAPPPLPTIPSYPAAPPLPPCLDKVMNCISDYAKTITPADLENFDPNAPICCPEWKDLIENDSKCYCDAAASSGAATNTSQIEMGLKKCNIDASADTLCLGSKGGASSNNTTKWTRLVSGLMMLLAGLLLC